jgi:hypothetical protein
MTDVRPVTRTTAIAETGAMIGLTLAILLWGAANLFHSFTLSALHHMPVSGYRVMIDERGGLVVAWHHFVALNSNGRMNR